MRFRLWIVLCALIAGTIFASSYPIGASSAVGNRYGSLTGRALAEHLNLKLAPTRPPGCNHYVEAQDGVYCLEGRIEPGAHGYEVAERLRGRIPTELDLQIYDLSWRISQFPPPLEENPDAQELIAQLDALLLQKSTASAG